MNVGSDVVCQSISMHTKLAAEMSHTILDAKNIFAETMNDITVRFLGITGVKGTDGRRISDMEGLADAMANTDDAKNCSLAHMASCFFLFFLVDHLKVVVSHLDSMATLVARECCRRMGRPEKYQVCNGTGLVPFVKFLEGQFKAWWHARKEQMKDKIRRRCQSYPLPTRPSPLTLLPEGYRQRNRLKEVFCLWKRDKETTAKEFVRVLDYRADNQWRQYKMWVGQSLFTIDGRLNSKYQLTGIQSAMTPVAAQQTMTSFSGAHGCYDWNRDFAGAVTANSYPFQNCWTPAARKLKAGTGAMDMPSIITFDGRSSTPRTAMSDFTPTPVGPHLNTATQQILHDEKSLKGSSTSSEQHVADGTLVPGAARAENHAESSVTISKKPQRSTGFFPRLQTPETSDSSEAMSSEPGEGEKIDEIVLETNSCGEDSNNDLESTRVNLNKRKFEANKEEKGLSFEQNKHKVVGSQEANGADKGHEEGGAMITGSVDVQVDNQQPEGKSGCDKNGTSKERERAKPPTDKKGQKKKRKKDESLSRVKALGLDKSQSGDSVSVWGMGCKVCLYC
mmetsp:Transcript_21035/g.51751  ORF Transcript_21035/g.51751 Transcript_21035/m.51751 type:complete len:564 (-) Transcript_21035:437-2128(-)